MRVRFLPGAPQLKVGMLNLFTLLDTPHVLYMCTVGCFIIALVFAEGMRGAYEERKRISYITFALLSILLGIAGWIGFVITLLQCVNAGFHP